MVLLLRILKVVYLIVIWKNLIGSQNHIINTKKAFYSELEEIFYEHPKIFSKTKTDGEDMILHAFILHEI